MSNSITLDIEVDMLEKISRDEDMRFEENIRHEVRVAPDIKSIADANSGNDDSAICRKRNLAWIAQKAGR